MEAQYPEHEKLQKIAEQSQALGEFLEWLPTQGIHLMRWFEGDEEVTCEGDIYYHCTEGRRVSSSGHDLGVCKVCNGTRITSRHREAWVPNGKSISNLLAEFFEIDRDKIDLEKRAMLITLRDRY